MKKSIIIIATGLMFSATVKAQTGKHEIRITGYSEGSSIRIKDDVSDGFARALASALVPGLDIYVQKDYKLYGFFGLGYRNQITERIKVGGDLGYMKSEQTFGPKTATTSNTDDIKKTRHMFIAMPVVEYSYIKTPWLNFYGSAAAGINFTSSTERKNRQTEKDNKVGFAYQVSPAGLRVGKKLAGFVEVGYGNKGIVTAGISYGF
ncbi:hypothetical protein [Chryseobacterium angstadtii]|uniref:hypothetical protein n=1 Tax=Chryseobacterium angstadtii TaxID=558151 RepID=UPI00065AA3B9|nr:hypothetical protein [Chryseobacterium angstadtii]